MTKKDTLKLNNSMTLLVLSIRLYTRKVYEISKYINRIIVFYFNYQFLESLRYKWESAKKNYKASTYSDTQTYVWIKMKCDS